MKINKKKKVYVIGILLFLGSMLFFTIRMWYQREYNTPSVSYVYSHKDNISHKINGTGRLSFEKTEQVIYEEGLVIDQCFVEYGEAVKSGDELCRYDLQSLNGQLDEIRLKLLENLFLISQIANEDYREILLLRIEILRKKEEFLAQLQEQDGYVKAERDGWVIGVDEEGITLGTGGVSVAGEFSGYYGNPDELTGLTVDVKTGNAASQGKTLPGKILPGKTLQGKITDCVPKDGNVECIIEIDAMGEYASEVTFSMEWAGETYPVCLPKEILYMENDEYYVYVIEEQRGILGNTLIAAKRNVSLLDVNDDLAAVEGNLPATEKIIAYSDKALYDGCPIALEN